MSQSLKIIFFGNEHLATGITSSPLLFQSLLDSRHEVLALVIHSSEQTGRNQTKQAIIHLAEEHNIPVFNPSKTIECLDLLNDFHADCGVLAAYGKIVPEEVIAMFSYGIINLHPSLLPKLRGSTPLESAILEGASQTGVSVMKLAKQMDAGPVYRQEAVTISPNITKQALADVLQQKGTEMIVDVLDNIEDFTTQLHEQDELQATFCSLISKQDGTIDWAESAQLIERKIRAYAGWPKSSCIIAEKRCVIQSAEVSPENLSNLPGQFEIKEDKLGVQTGSGTLWITTLQPEGKKEMSIKAFLAGYRSKIN